MPYIEVMPPAAADGRLKEVYDQLAKQRGSIANVHQIASLDPALMQGHLDFYMTLMYGKGGLSRRERELIATAVSRANQCGYCTIHHVEALAKYEKNTTLLDTVSKDPDNASLSPRDRALVAYALKLTRAPAAVGEEDAQALRDAGFTDKDVLAAAAVTAYFNFVNRLVLGLGVQLEQSEARAYKY